MQIVMKKPMNHGTVDGERRYSGMRTTVEQLLQRKVDAFGVARTSKKVPQAGHFATSFFCRRRISRKWSTDSAPFFSRICPSISEEPPCDREACSRSPSAS